jgi:hypothetical protein
MTAGSAGGSSGGGSSSPNVLAGTGGTSYGNRGGIHSGNKTEYAGGGGGAGGPGTVGQINRNYIYAYGGPGRASSITGISVTYAAGGPIAGFANRRRDGTANTGEGGSGIVVVRFQRNKVVRP